MKILQINKFYYLKGGSERYLFELSKILEENGHKVIPFSTQNNQNEKSEYSKYFIKLINLDKFNIKNIIKFFWNYDAIKQLEKLIKKEKPNIVHLHNIAHQISPAIIHTLKKHNIPIVQTLHDYKLICPNYQLFNRGKICEKCNGGKYYNCIFNKCVKDSFAKSLLATLEAYLHNKILKTYDKVDKFIAPSQFMKDKCVEFGVEEKRIEVVNNFIEASDVKTNIGGYLLYFGRLSKEKGLEMIYESRIKNQEYLLVGDGEMKKELENKIKKENIENVKLLGYKSGDELNELIQNAKAIIIPSIWYENMPYSMLEAMAIGKIVIASNIGGMAEIIKNGENGFLFEAGNSDELREIIEKLDSSDLEKIGQNAKKSIKKLNKNWHMDRILDIYSKCKKR